MDDPARDLATRLQRVVEAVDAFERNGYALPLHLPDADTDGDAVGRLADRIERLSARVMQQLAALQRLATQRRDLLTNVSHDLRTPLASMQGYLELLLLRHGSLEPAEQRNYLETAARQTERLARLVADLFQLAELDGEAAPLAAEDFALAELLHDVAQRYAPDAQRRKVDLCTVTPAPLAVHADIALVERVLSALVENALRHTPPGGQVTIELTGEATRAQVSVRDTGEGIADDEVSSLFDRYDRTERVAGSAATPHGGLGLAIARRAVQLHGGELRVASTPGVGTQVLFDLPLAARARLALEPVAASTSATPESAVPTDRIALLERCVQQQRAAIERSEAARATAEADLRAVEQRYVLALRGSQDGLWEWDLDSDRVHLSPRWKSMLGFDAEEIRDDRDAWFARVHAEDRTAFERALRRHLDDRDALPFDHDLRLMHKDGGVRHVLSRGVAIRGEDGRAHRVVGLDTDVTRVRRLQAVLDALADGMAGAHGDAFFPALVRNFGRALDVSLAFIAECLDDPPTRVRTLACWNSADGDVPNFEFALAGTPCEEVIQDGRSCFHRDDLESMFPRERGYAAYLGLPVRGRDGRVLGHLAFFDRIPRGDDMLVDSVFRIFLARAADEMERRRGSSRNPVTSAPRAPS
ncbi:MAG TPA: ATP-binding protein [Burkholderiaceae bacterium]|nr:ATP-binding protein [Burkholderiaceae bacterium]